MKQLPELNTAHPWIQNEIKNKYIFSNCTYSCVRYIYHLQWMPLCMCYFFVICNLPFHHLLFLFYCMTDKNFVDINHWKKCLESIKSIDVLLIFWCFLVLGINGVYRWYVRNTAWTFDMKKTMLCIYNETIVDTFPEVVEVVKLIWLINIKKIIHSQFLNEHLYQNIAILMVNILWRIILHVHRACKWYE